MYVDASAVKLLCAVRSRTCLRSPGGTIDTFVGVAPYYGDVHILAKDLTRSKWSCFATTYVRITP